MDTHGNDIYLLWILMGITSTYCGHSWEWPLPIVDTHGNDLYLLWTFIGMTSTYCGYSWEWLLPIVATHGKASTYCGYSWEWPLPIVETHGNDLYSCRYSWEWSFISYIPMVLASTVASIEALMAILFSWAETVCTILAEGIMVNICVKLS